MQAADSDRSTALVKGNQNQTPRAMENILSWARNNLMTINLTRTKEMVVKGKVERPPPSITFDIKQEVFFKLLGVYFLRNRTNWEK